MRFEERDESGPKTFKYFGRAQPYRDQNKGIRGSPTEIRTKVSEAVEVTEVRDFVVQVRDTG